jgi:hypothetical protein
MALASWGHSQSFYTLKAVNNVKNFETAVVILPLLTGA